LKTRNIKQQLYKLPLLLKPRFLTIIVAIVAIFNILSTKVLPRDIFVVFASDINTNELVTLANSERVTRGLDELTIDSRLVSAALAKGQDMIEKDYWSHFGPNGESPWQFILAAGYDYIYAGENLAKDFTLAAPIHSAWMASPSHRSNILNGNFKNIGIASITGEFQGEETTVVVQMFGTTNIEHSESISDGENTSGLPVTGDSDIASPVITDPEDGDILQTGAFDVRGEASEGSEVEVFDNNENLGKTSINDSRFEFKKDEPYADGVHTLHAVASDDDGNKSNSSDIVNVIVDTIAPFIDSETAKFEYTETGTDFKNYIFSVKVLDNPNNVSGEYNKEQLIFTYIEEGWQCTIKEDSETFKDLKVSATDAAGNLAEHQFSGSELSSFAKEISSQGKGSKQKTFWQDTLSRVFTRSLRGQINFAIAFIMILLLIIQQIVLAKTGFTKENIGSMLHLPVFAVILFVGLLGGGGEIL
jgi:hypothetical protein